MLAIEIVLLPSGTTRLICSSYLLKLSDLRWGEIVNAGDLLTITVMRKMARVKVVLIIEQGRV